MILEQAMSLIEHSYKGYMVHFEWKEGCILRGDYFPDKQAQEKLISTEEEAWILASKFAHAMKGGVVNLYVIDQDFMPVRGYKDKEIKNR